MQLINHEKVVPQRRENPEGPVDIKRLAGVDSTDEHRDHKLTFPPGHLDTYICAGFRSRVKRGVHKEVSID